MLRIGLTGGIGSGKTTAADFFKALGIFVIEADDIARRLTNKNSDIYSTIVEKFGPRILTADQSINRKKLGDIIFNDPEKKEWLESLMHPLIKKMINEAIEKSESPYCIIVIPLLVETQAFDLVDRVLVVDAPVEIQMQRVIQRDAREKELIKTMINHQVSREERLAHATDIICNEGSKEQLFKKVEQQHHFYLQLVSKS